jgi:hypothetical protein
LPCAADSLSEDDLARLAAVRVDATALTRSERERLRRNGIGDLAALAMRESAEISALCAGDPVAITRLADALRRSL